MAKKLRINVPHKPFKGKHFRITQKAQVITIDPDPVKLGEPVAQAWRDEVERGIKAISAQGKDKTHRYANVTGLLARGLRIVRQGDVWATIAPPGRLGEGWTQEALNRFLARLGQLVTAIGQPERTFKSRPLQAALKASLKAAHKVSRLKKG